MEMIDRLAEHKTLAAAPREELAWLAAHGTLRRLAAGERFVTKGEPVTELAIVLTGHLTIYVDRPTGRDRVREWRAGDVTGFLPYSRMVGAPGNSIAEEPTEIFAVPRDVFPAMIRECHQVTSILVHEMVDRARVFTSSDLRDEKMKSLGKMSAGLAHELNNPASAIERNAALLDERLDESERTARALGAAHLSDADRAAIESLRACCIGSVAHGVLSPLEQAEREDAITDWLEEHGVNVAAAVGLSDTNVTVAALDRLAASIDASALDVVVQWAAASCSVHRLASEIKEAAMRISGLVYAIKSHTHMDQASVAEPVDLRASLGNSVTVMGWKAREKSASVTVTVPPDLPRVRGFVGELNEIWGNLLDNALDAIGQGGRVDVTAAHERDHVVVRVIDNGPGIPADVRPRLFEPFFTTKPIGKGTGLGLDIVRRLISHNDAAIEVDSSPGRTEFRVMLPLAEAASRASS